MCRLRYYLPYLYFYGYLGASLDFGVFLCSNCSGAHRALGPTITRVRSANLDIWQNEWVNNMLIGNEEVNKYWESHPSVSMRYLFP